MFCLPFHAVQRLLLHLWREFHATLWWPQPPRAGLQLSCSEAAARLGVEEHLASPVGLWHRKCLFPNAQCSLVSQNNIFEKNKLNCEILANISVYVAAPWYARHRFLKLYCIVSVAPFLCPPLCLTNKCHQCFALIVFLLELIKKIACVLINKSHFKFHWGNITADHDHFYLW